MFVQPFICRKKRQREERLRIKAASEAENKEIPITTPLCASRTPKPRLTRTSTEDISDDSREEEDWEEDETYDRVDTDDSQEGEDGEEDETYGRVDTKVTKVANRPRIRDETVPNIA